MLLAVVLALAAAPPTTPPPAPACRADERVVVKQMRTLFNPSVPVTSVEGEAPRRLDGRVFYDVVGREDLGDLYDDNRNRNYGFGFGIGGPLVAAGVVAGVVGTVWSVEGHDVDADPRRLGEGLFAATVGITLFSFGMDAILIGLSVPPDPVDGPAARRLADVHNALPVCAETPTPAADVTAPHIAAR